MKSFLSTPLTRFLKKAITDPKNINFHKQEYLIKKSIGKKKVISYVPGVFTIYITFRCNFRCAGCQFLLQDKDSLQGSSDMKLEDFKWILDHLGKNIHTVILGGGEPTLHPQFSEIVQEVKKRNLKLQMSTNGTFIIQRINDLKYFDKINVSINGLDYQTFQRLTNTTEKQFNDVMAGIRLLKEHSISFRISFVFFEENLSEIDKLLQFAREIKPEVLMLRSGNPHGSESLHPLTANSDSVKSFLKKVLSKNDYPFSIKLPTVFNSDSKEFNVENCSLPWLEGFIGPTGDIAYCCHLKFNPEIGNIFKNYNFNSEKMVKFREAMINHKYPKNCLYCQRRFMDKDEYSGFFNPGTKKWVLSPFYQKFLP
ncbi:MAG: radical SAM protein [Candidatus Nealsonbacteria bacterium]